MNTDLQPNAEQPRLTRKVNAFAGVCISVHLCLSVVSAFQLPNLGSKDTEKGTYVDSDQPDCFTRRVAAKEGLDPDEARSHPPYCQVRGIDDTGGLSPALSPAAGERGKLLQFRVLCMPGTPQC